MIRFRIEAKDTSVCVVCHKLTIPFFLPLFDHNEAAPGPRDLQLMKVFGRILSKIRTFSTSKKWLFHYDVIYSIFCSSPVPGCGPHDSDLVIDKSHLYARLLTHPHPLLVAPTFRHNGKTFTTNYLEAILEPKVERDRGTSIALQSVLGLPCLDRRPLLEGLAITSPDSCFHVGQTEFSVIRLNFGLVQVFEIAFLTLSSEGQFIDVYDSGAQLSYT